eukprot:TRINITY_DN755_c0_g1_i1.p1 TRINITY_DN755_c0_g1~~TRINITY_DN755_c0_g1_i1.p1  ORF type:complete len:141 (+),score=10.84 TRINITY_DN755_c0_g1_i1:61-483(+)
MADYGHRRGNENASESRADAVVEKYRHRKEMLGISTQKHQSEEDEFLEKHSHMPYKHQALSQREYPTTRQPLASQNSPMSSVFGGTPIGERSIAAPNPALTVRRANPNATPMLPQPPCMSPNALRFRSGLKSPTYSTRSG